jgi:AcrR family transcriptional regulator
VPRSGADARQRLQQAALELYRERGFDQTTTAEIAARAGVNHRTFFRHFPDKREVLFDDEADLRAALMGAVAQAPAELQPLGVLMCAFHAAGQILERHRPFSQPRLEVIASSPALRERELAKADSMIEAMSEALQHRGVPAGLADLASHAGWAAFHQAVEAWVVDPSQDWQTHLTHTFDDLRRLATAAIDSGPVPSTE